MHRLVEIQSGKRDPHGTVDVVELYCMPHCLLANSPGKYKSHGRHEIQPYVRNCGSFVAFGAIGDACREPS